MLAQPGRESGQTGVEVTENGPFCAFLKELRSTNLLLNHFDQCFHVLASKHVRYQAYAHSPLSMISLT